jgi:hypothetical protein
MIKQRWPSPVTLRKWRLRIWRKNIRNFGFMYDLTIVDPGNVDLYSGWNPHRKMPHYMKYERKNKQKIIIGKLHTI